MKRVILTLTYILFEAIMYIFKINNINCILIPLFSNDIISTVS